MALTSGIVVSKNAYTDSQFVTENGHTLEFVVPPFDGPEKKLEIGLSAARDTLRSNNDGRWHRVVEASGARIISRRSTADLDAYLLSESSLFVWSDRIVMITCGSTTLTNALPEILRVVGGDRVAYVLYQRQKGADPHKQAGKFTDDVFRLKGHLAGETCRAGQDSGQYIDIFHTALAGDAAGRKATLQLAMRNLNAESMNRFRSTDCETSIRQETFAELDGIYPFALTDRHLFSPSGYSMNGISGENYFTVHVTPQSEGSYASFETNFTESDYGRVLKKVVPVFEPDLFTLCLFTSVCDRCRGVNIPFEAVPGYVPEETCHHDLNCGFAMTFVSFRAGR
jgi:S-adenosylmethionine decarboxylase